MTALHFNQVTIDVSDLDASIAFYKAIGLTLIVYSPANGYARFESRGDSGTLSLHVTEHPQTNGASLYFESVELDDVVAELKAAGLAFDEDPVDQRWGWREAWTRDPDGRRIAIYRAGDHRRFPPWRVDAKPASPSNSNL